MLFSPYVSFGYILFDHFLYMWWQFWKIFRRGRQFSLSYSTIEICFLLLIAVMHKTCHFAQTYSLCARYTFVLYKDRNFDGFYSSWCHQKEKKKSIWYVNSCIYMLHYQVCFWQILVKNKALFMPVMTRRTFCRVASGSLYILDHFSSTPHSSGLLSSAVVLLTYGLWLLWTFVSWPC